MKKLSFGNKRIYVFSKEEEDKIEDNLCHAIAHAELTKLNTIGVLERLRVPCENDVIARTQLKFMRDKAGDAMDRLFELLRIF